MKNSILLPEDKVKNIIIEILGVEWPLTAKRIHNKIKKEYKREVSYQATFKALKEMKDEGILKKDNYDYSLNAKWINDTCEKYEDMKRSYQSKTDNILLKFIREKTFTVEFDTYYKALSTFLHLMDKLGFLVKKNNNGNFVEARHLYWPFAGSEQEQEKIIKNSGCFKANVLCNSKTPVDKMILKYYKKMSPQIKVVLGKTVTKDHETIITGDFVGQIYYQKDFIRALDKAYKKDNVDKVEEMFDLLFNKQTKITAVITKNSEFANLKRMRILQAMN